jgi:hypothetical protein
MANLKCVVFGYLNQFGNSINVIANFVYPEIITKLLILYICSIVSQN